MKVISTVNLRLIIGLLQGIAIYFLHEEALHATWPTTNTIIFVPLSLIVFAIPVLTILNLGHMPTKMLAAWTLVASAVLVELGIHDVMRRGDGMSVELLFRPILFQTSLSLTFFAFVIVFIAQSLVMASAIDNRRIATYKSYFDAAWNLSVQFSFSTAFTIIFWLVLGMGTSLFALIKITFMVELLKHSWFNIPATSVAFSYALHITDIRVNLVRGIRTLKLTLLSWLLPIMAVFVAIFLIALPFQGITILWNTHHTSQILLCTAAWLILLINAAYQDGSAENRPGKVLRYSGILGSVLVLPLVSIAFYALSLRVGEYGWTVNTIDISLCLVITLCYAVGYLIAIFSHGPWLQRIEKTNIYTSFVILIILLAIFSPLADPARLSVADQVARLESGKVSAIKFDYMYLKNKGASYEIEALKQLRTNASGPDADIIKQKVDEALVQRSEWRAPVPISTPPKAEEIVNNITVYPTGHDLPETFVKKDWGTYEKDHKGLPFCLSMKTAKCDAFIVDATSDMPQQIILVNVMNIMMGSDYTSAALFKAVNSDWELVGHLSGLLSCKGVRDALRAGEYKITSSVGQDLEVNGIRIEVNHNDTCPYER